MSRCRRCQQVVDPHDRVHEVDYSIHRCPNTIRATSDQTIERRANTRAAVILCLLFTGLMGTLILLWLT